MKVSSKHGYRRQRAADGLPSIRQQEKEKKATRAQRVADEKKRVSDMKAHEPQSRKERRHSK